jgi:hypothetical protein
VALGGQPWKHSFAEDVISLATFRLVVAAVITSKLIAVPASCFVEHNLVHRSFDVVDCRTARDVNACSHAANAVIVSATTSCRACHGLTSAPSSGLR